jgi:hypothetical protein
MEIDFEGQYEQKQYLRAIKMVLTPSKRSTLVRIAIFIAILAVVLFLYFHGMQDGDFGEIDSNRFKLASFFGLMLTVYMVVPYLGINRTAERLWKKPSVQKVKTGKITDEGITYGDRLKTWDSYIRKYIFKDMVLLITADEGMSLLQRNFFKDEMDWKRFLQMVDQYTLKAKNYKVK